MVHIGAIPMIAFPQIQTIIYLLMSNMRLVKEVVSLHELGQLVGMACKRVCAQTTEKQKDSERM